MDHSTGEPPQPSKTASESPSEAAPPPPVSVIPEKQTADGSASDNLDLNAADGSEAKSAATAIKSPKSVRWSEQLVSESTFTASVDRDEASSYPARSDPYTAHSSTAPPVSFKERVDTVRDVLGRWGVNVKEAAKKAETLAGNTWQHLKTSPSFTDAAMGRLAHSTKVIAEGGYEKIFRHTFETAPDEQLKSSFACYLSTSAGPVMGALYLSTAKLAFCSDNPLPYKNADQTEWSYYKVVIPLHQLKAVNPSSNRVNPSEKYIQIISVDSHEFWYMGFLNYEGAVESLQEALQASSAPTV